MENEELKVVVLSYVPLMTGEAGRSDLDIDEITEAFEQCPDGTADGCVWLQDNDGTTYPCLLYDGAEQLAEHLKLWAENEPGEWFQLVIAEYGGRYGMALIPKFDKGIERFRIAYQLRNGFPLPENLKYEFIFRPLHFMSRFDHVFSKIKSNIANGVKVALMQASEYKDDDPSSINWDNVMIELGEFEVVMDGPLTQYVLDNLKDSDEVIH